MTIKNNTFLNIKKISYILFCVFLLYLFSKIPYINLLFPFWIDFILVWLFSIKILPLRKEMTIIICIILWIFAYLSLLLQLNGFAEELSIISFFLFVFYFFQLFLIDVKK